MNQAAVESVRFQKQLEQLYDNPFDDQKFMEIDDDQFDDEVENLIEWCEDLDYDKYIENWHTQATSAKPITQDDDKELHVFDLGMGDLTIGLAQSGGADGADGQFSSHKMDLSHIQGVGVADGSQLGSQNASVH